MCIRDRAFTSQAIALLFNLIVAIISVIYLFEVAEIGFSTYPVGLFITNVIAIILCLVILAISLPNLKASLEVELLLFFPTLILLSIQMLICFAYVNNITFS